MRGAPIAQLSANRVPAPHVYRYVGWLTRQHCRCELTAANPAPPVEGGCALSPMEQLVCYLRRRLIGSRHGKHPRIRERCSSDLQADRQTVGGVPTGY